MDLLNKDCVKSEDPDARDPGSQFMREQPCLRLQDDGIEVEFGISLCVEQSIATDSTDPRMVAIRAGLRAVESQVSTNEVAIQALNQEIDKLTNHADGVDYIVAVGSGILAGLIDSFWVGTFDFRRGKAWSNREVNEFVMKVAKAQGYEGKRLDGAIQYLENRFKVPGDSLWKGRDVGISAQSHHLDDLAHHPSLLGLICSIATQFTKIGFFQDKDGAYVWITVDEKGEELIGTDIPSKIFAGTVNWFFHLVSDMSGSNKTAGVGMGIPGPLLSLLKELSLIPGINKTGLAKKAHQAFVKGRFDLRSELAFGHEVARQAVPVLINEVIVRAFYFARQLTREVREKRDFASIDWAKTLPWKNRTIVRMLTIATGTFTAVDLVDAAIRAGLKSGGDPATFGTQLLLRVNFVGIGRFAIAIASDVRMGVSRGQLVNDRIAIFSEQLHLANAKVFYSQADMWVSAESAQDAIAQALQGMTQTARTFQELLHANETSLRQIAQYAREAEKRNPGLTDKVLRELSL